MFQLCWRSDQALLYSSTTMAAKSSTSPPILEQPEAESAATVDGIDKKLHELGIKSDDEPKKKKTSQPSSNLSIHPAPYVNVQSPIFHPQVMSPPPNNERSYLLENRQRQHERGQRLSDALHIIEVRITSAQSKTEGRKLRKEAGLLKKKITDSLTQEQLITLRLNDIQNEEFSRNPYWQAQSAGLIPYQTPWSPYSPMTAPWSPMALPISPLTPLPPGLYHPSPVMPSPLGSPYWMGAQYQYQMAAPYLQNDPAYYLGMGFQQPYIPEGIVAEEPSRGQSMAPAVGKLLEAAHKSTKSVDFKLPEDGAHVGRRWSLADTFSPIARDKRMSMPGLETIWKGEKEKEE